MIKNISESVKLYGTDEPVTPMQSLTAGPVSCKFDQGALRFIKIYGKEAIRNIAFVVRDKDWGTYLPTLGNVKIDQKEDSFYIEFDAVCKDEEQEIHYTASITGNADGSLLFNGKYTAITDFLTNRTGFVVLHPIAGVAGEAVAVESVNGEVAQSEFPALVDPVQPFMNIRALTHEVLPGVSICCRMTGDTFEMEDHRQWNDASYKTYVRPIALPWPFTISAKESLQQSVSLTIVDATEIKFDKNGEHGVGNCILTVEKPDLLRPMPKIGMGLEPRHMTGALATQHLLHKLAPHQFALWYDLSQHNSEHLKQASELAKRTDVRIELQAVIPDINFKKEIATLANQCREAKLSPVAVHVAPAAYLSSIMPGTSWPDVTSLAQIYEQVRQYFPDVAVGGGMLSFFPELNRHRPPTEHLDFISHASNTITHACDDITATENLEAIPFIINTARSFASDKPYHVGPSSIGMRFNPYGSKTMDNPDNARIAMACMDPRQRGLLNAAWTVGYVAHMARGGVDCINLHAPTGEFGIFNYPEDWSRPGYDGSTREVYPAYHVVAGFVQAVGKPQLAIHSSMSRELEAVGYQEDDKCIIWIANLTGDTHHLEISGVNMEQGRLACLTVDTFDECTQSVDGFENTTTSLNTNSLALGPYHVARLTVPSAE